MKDAGLFSLTDKISAAGLDPTLWQDCIDEVNNILDGRVGSFYTFDTSTQEISDFYLSSDHDPVWLEKITRMVRSVLSVYSTS